MQEIHENAFQLFTIKNRLTIATLSANWIYHKLRNRWRFLSCNFSITFSNVTSRFRSFFIKTSSLKHLMRICTRIKQSRRVCSTEFTSFRNVLEMWCDMSQDKKSTPIHIFSIFRSHNVYVLIKTFSILFVKLKASLESQRLMASPFADPQSLVIMVNTERSIGRCESLECSFRNA